MNIGIVDSVAALSSVRPPNTLTIRPSNSTRNERAEVSAPSAAAASITPNSSAPLMNAIRIRRMRRVVMGGSSVRRHGLLRGELAATHVVDVDQEVEERVEHDQRSE